MNNVIEADFRAALKNAGLDYDGEILPDAGIQRFKVNGDNSKNCWYLLYSDGIAAGSFGNWKTGLSERWCAKSNAELSENERTERDRKWKQQQQEREADRQRQQDKSAAKAALILEAKQPALDSHPYHINKGVKAAPGVLVGQWEQRGRDHCLLIPFKNAAGQITTVQAISADQPLIGDSNKDWLIGGKKSGSFFTFGDPVQAAQIIVCEGYATGASIHEATGDCVIVAGDAGNLKPVAAAISIHHKPILIAADNDLDNPDNPGLKAAKVAAELVKGAMAAPNFTPDEVTAWRSAHGGKCPSDFNDLATLRGLDAVKTLLTLPVPQTQPTVTSSLLKYDKNGNPSLVAHNQAADLLYDSEFQSLLYYDPVVCNWYQYQPTGIFSVRPELAVQQAVYRAISKYAGDLGFSASYVSGVSKCLLYKAIRQPEPQPGTVCFKNGVLDLRSRTLLPHSPDHFFTNQLPFNWEHNAPDPQPVIDWLKEATGGHDDQVQLLRAYLHAVIVGRPDLQRFLEIIGPGGSGKGTAIRLCNSLVGTSAIHATALKQLEENRFETAKIFNKKLVVITDAEKWHGDVSVLKSITGQDPIRFEEKNKQSGDSFTYGGMVLIAANQHTTSTDYSSGIQRRRITVAFDHVVPADQRRDLDAEFEPLLPGVVRWVLDMPDHEVTAYLRSTSTRVKSLNAVRLETLEATNPIVAWLRSSCSFDPAAATHVGAKERLTITTGDMGSKTSTVEYKDWDAKLYPSYCRWCDHNGKQPISLQTFSRTVIDASKNMLGKPFVEKVKDSKGSMAIRGLQLRRPYGDSTETYVIDSGDKGDFGDLKEFIDISSMKQGSRAEAQADPISENCADFEVSGLGLQSLRNHQNQALRSPLGLRNGDSTALHPPVSGDVSDKPCSLCRHLIPGKVSTCGQSHRAITAINTETCSEFAGRGVIQGGAV